MPRSSNGRASVLHTEDGGSIPPRGTKFNLSKVLSGCIRDLGSCGPGSNPGRETKLMRG